MHVRNTYAGCKSTAQICYKSHCKRVHVFHSMATDEQPRIMIITHGELSSAQSRPDVPSTTSLAALGEEQASSDSQLLLPKLYTVPTASRKLHGLKDIMLLLAALIPYLLMKVFRCGQPLQHLVALCIHGACDRCAMQASLLRLPSMCPGLCMRCCS